MQDNIVEIGKYILQPQKYRAFIPHRFPPAGRIEFNDRITKTFKGNPGSKSVRWRVFTYPGHGLFLEMFVLKDATSSAQIEGTRATMIDAIEAGNIEKPSNIPIDTEDIIHYKKL